MELQAGDVLDDRYRLIEAIGSGGMGDVWKVEREGLETPLALKVLKDSGADHIKVERFMREARAVAMLEHPNIVVITDFGHTHDGLPFFVMEHLKGRTLGALMKEHGPLPLEWARHLLLQLVDALGFAHDQGIYHRDLKPNNIFAVGDLGREVCKIIDFGIAKFSEVHDDLRTLTQTGIIQGTPAYMSPEQARGQKVDHRSDQYSLGILAYELLSGVSPYRSANVRDTLYKQVFTHPEPLRKVRPGIPESVEAVVTRMLRKDVTLRFADMAETWAAMESMGEGATPVHVPEEKLPSVSVESTDAAAPSMVTKVEPWPAGAAAPARGRGMVLSMVVGIAVGVAGVGAVATLMLPDNPPVSAPLESRPAAPTAAAHRASVAAPAPPAPAGIAGLPLEPVADPDPELGPESTPEPPTPAPVAGDQPKKKRRGKGAAAGAQPAPAPAPKPKPELDPALTDPFSRL